MSGLHHVALTVTDLDRSVEWYRGVFALDIQLEERSDTRQATILRSPDGALVIGLVAHGGGGSFDPSVVGLDHVAVAAATREEIEGWATRLDDLGVGHSGVIDVPVGAILNFKDPDGIALAVFWDAPG